MIARKAIRRFLNRPLRDSDKLKRWSAGKVRRVFKSFDPPALKTKLRLHQKVGFILGARHPHYLIFYSPGLGKSLIILYLLKYARMCARKDRIDPPRMLVLVPNASNVGQWEDEVAKHSSKLLAIGVDEAGADNRWAQIEEESAHIVIITYMGFLALICNSNPDTEAKKKWVIDEKKLKLFIKRFGFICFDEATAMKNHQSLTYRACKKLSWPADYAYGLTGTPFGKDPGDLWSQFHVIDKGETLGDTLGLFRGALFTSKKNYWSGFPEYKFDQRKKKALARLIRHNSIRYEGDECLDLPPLVEIEREVVFPQETWTYYDRLVEELKDAKGAFRVIESAFLRMRYLTAGYLTVKDPEGEKVHIRFKTNPKMEAMLADIDDIDPERKIIIFYEYNSSGDLICEALKKAKIKHVRLWSKARGKKELVGRFLRDPKVRIIVSSSAGAYGGNWQVADHVMFFECPSSPLLLKQEMHRCYRMGQERRVTAFYYQVKGSIDQKIRRSHRLGEDLFRALIDGKKAAKSLARR